MPMTIALPLEIRYEQSPQVARAAARWLLKWQQESTRIFLGVILLVGLPPILFDAFHDRVGWIDTAFGAVLTMLLWGHRLSRADYLRRSEFRARSMRDPSVVVTFGNDSFTVWTEDGSSTLVWSAVKTVWKSDDFWALLFEKDQPFLIIPASALPPDLQAFINWRVKQNEKIKPKSWEREEL